MRRPVRFIFTFLALAVLFAGTALADLYPIAPPGSFVSLNAGDFIQFVPEESAGLPSPNPVIGDNLGQHPGAFAVGFPPVGTYFIGVFNAPIDVSNPNAAVYLWETSGFGDNNVPFFGPEIRLGFWDPMGFTPYGNAQSASYLGTGALGNNPGYEITSSVTPLSGFGILPGFPFELNAVRIEATAQGHPQVTAVAVNTVPEPSSIVLLGAIVGLLGCGWRRQRA